MTTLNLQVAAGADDTREIATGSCNHTATNTLQETAATVPAYGAFRWQANVPQGATIDSATLTLQMTNTNYDDPVADVYGFAADTVAAFDSTANEVSGKTATTAVVDWTGTSLGKDDLTINVKPIVQEIVNRVSWSADNYIGMAVKSRTGCNVRIVLYEMDSAKAAKLDIAYTPAATGGAVSKTSRVRLSSMVGGRLT